MLRVAAVDLGATSARVAVVDLDAEPLAVDIVHRYAHQPVFQDGALRWDWARLMAEVERGLARALDGGPLASIGVDTWAVDYGLLDASGALVAPPVSYRDGRTAGWRDVAERLGAERLYRTTGIQVMGINTVFQLAAHDRREIAAANRLLFLPELAVNHLCGAVTAEVTSAGASSLVDVTTGAWSSDLIDDLGIDGGLFPPIRAAGAALGSWRGVPVHLVAGHDTASAVAARPADAPAASVFVSAGTWVIVGAERPAPDVSEQARAANFSNEPGALGGTRFLKNVTGLWLLERCRAAWGDPPIEELIAAAADAAAGPTVFTNDERFVNPADMEAEIRSVARLSKTASRADVVRCVLESIAADTSAVIDELRTFLGSPIDRIDLLGGGARIDLLGASIRERTGTPTAAGSAEATALGNALVQGTALGRFEDLAEARRAGSPAANVR